MGVNLCFFYCWSSKGHEGSSLIRDDQTFPSPATHSNLLQEDTGAEFSMYSDRGLGYYSTLLVLK